MVVRFAALALLDLVLASAHPPDVGMLRIVEDANKQSSDSMAPQCDKHLPIGRYYIGKRDYAAAIGRIKTMLQNCPKSSGTPEALAHLTEAFLAMGIPLQAQTAVAVLERKFPDARSTIDARKALGSAGLTPREDEKSWIARAFR
jgi:outer membrane protein assembly factor BamD